MAEGLPPIPRSVTSVYEHVGWQLDFLDASIARYDDGYVHEAQRIAICLRVLCSDSPPGGGRRNVSLLRQLDFLDHWEFNDTAPVDDGTLVMPWSICAQDVPTGHGVRWRACGAEFDEGRRSLFKEWWSGTILATVDEKYTRTQIVMGVTNQDGGAHVDPKLKPWYHHLAVAAGMHGSTAGVESVVRHPIWELLRQIGYEMQATTNRYNPNVPRPRARPQTGHPTVSVASMRVVSGTPDPSESVGTVRSVTHQEHSGPE